MKPSRFRGVLSQGMLLAATSNDNRVALLEPAADSQVGERIQVDTNNDDEQQQPAEKDEKMMDSPPILKPKQRVFESVAEFLKTDENGTATYKGQPLKTNAGGYVSCPTIPNGQIS